jgi:hypothetical protein
VTCNLSLDYSLLDCKVHRSEWQEEFMHYMVRHVNCSPDPLTLSFLLLDGPMQLQSCQSLYVKSSNQLLLDIIENIRILPNQTNDQKWPCWVSKQKNHVVNYQKRKIFLREFICAVTLKAWQLHWDGFFQICPCIHNQSRKIQQRVKDCCFTKLKWSCANEIKDASNQLI